MKILIIISLFSLCIAVYVYPQTQFHKFNINDNIEVIKISDNCYVHISYSEIPPWGRVGSNGLIFADSGEAVLLDTPVTDSLTMDLINWIRDTLKVKIVAFVPNHWHSDCMGGLTYLNSLGIVSYANEITRQIAKEKNLPIPLHGFTDSLTLTVGTKNIICNYPGPAHTVDNIVVWIPSESVLFAGCMVKELKSTTLGNTADSNLKEYPVTIKKVMDKYQYAKFVVPGHGEFGGLELLQHTYDLSKK
jgi:metallo-beta-lactamase class B